MKIIEQVSFVLGIMFLFAAIWTMRHPTEMLMTGILFLVIASFFAIYRQI